MQRKFFFSFFLDKGKIQGYLPPNVVVPNLTFRIKYLYIYNCTSIFSHKIQALGRVSTKKRNFLSSLGGGHQRVKNNFFAFLDDSDHV